MIGIGSSYFGGETREQAVAALRRAYEGGINIFDLAAGHAQAFTYAGEALGDVRKDVLYQIHFGAYYETGEYGWSTDAQTVRRSLDWQLKTLGTDTIDYGFIHCLDEVGDWEDYRKGGTLAYLLEMKEQGIVKHLALSSHTPATAMRVMDEIQVDTLMFSINPGYDEQKGEYARGSVREREALYRRCERDGIGITVMKPFSGGQLLDAKLSPFGRALTRYQCLQYALDRPGVISVLPGATKVEEVEELLGFFDAPQAERDYAVLGSFGDVQMRGKCVYCNHCQPCPAGIDVGLVNKYYDLALAGDQMAAQHYLGLGARASDCLHCGHCDSRCPFGARQSERMDEIAAHFGV